MTVPRFWVVPPDKDGIYSISSRCVRRGFLLGKDPYTGVNYDHRKEWVRSRRPSSPLASAWKSVPTPQ